MNFSRNTAALFSGLALTLAASVGAAQDIAATPPPPPPPALQSVNASVAANAGGGTDHDRVLNQIGLRYFGFVGAPGGMGMPGFGVHNVGIRYWMNRQIAIEGGLGLALSAGAGGTAFGFALNAGLPINVAATQHLAIHIIPNVLIGLPSVSPTLLIIRASADAAAELHFGFIGVPQMSLQARMGIGVDLTLAGGNAQFSLATTPGSGGDVWSVISGSIAATYYFGR
ncbi:MAG: hypothetical protein Q8Q09_19505 [Deltaproteobacteria bacterium]|nr:hypothetical protein [Deltaproteobacteria bacterium]